MDRIRVTGTGMDSSFVQVTYFKQTADGSMETIFSVPGYCGHDGMTYEKREGDRRTPIGTFHFHSAFGVLPDPGSVLSYRVLDSQDYWVDDVKSPHYNQMVNEKDTKQDWDSAEHLSAIVPMYHYCFATDYNMDHPVPGKGSAIFFHGYHPVKTWTEGCIAIPEEYVKLLLQQVDLETELMIEPGEPGDRACD